MTDVLKLLPPMKWRGKVYPVLDRNVVIAQEAIEHRVQYQDDQYIEPLGVGERRFQYTLAMREDLFKGPYKHMFTKGLLELLRDFLDRSPGLLEDPIYGPFRCTPKLYDETTDNNKRDGTDVKVSFTYAPENIGAEAQSPTMAGLAADVGQVDDGSLTDWLNAFNGMIQQGLLTADKVAYRADDLIFRLRKMETSIVKAANPQQWRMMQTIRSMRDDAESLKIAGVTVASAKRKRSVTLPYAMGISAAASYAGVTLADLIRLNPGMASMIRVPKGTAINAG